MCVCVGRCGGVCVLCNFTINHILCDFACLCVLPKMCVCFTPIIISPAKAQRVYSRVPASKIMTINSQLSQQLTGFWKSREESAPTPACSVHAVISQCHFVEWKSSGPNVGALFFYVKLLWDCSRGKSQAKCASWWCICCKFLTQFKSQKTNQVLCYFLCISRSKYIGQKSPSAASILCVLCWRAAKTLPNLLLYLQ